MLAKALTEQDDITLVVQKDYIANPKPNGYRSIHLIVSVPVFFSEQVKHLKVEVQIRTISMDFGASLEHQLKYKQEHPDSTEVAAELKGVQESSQTPMPVCSKSETELKQKTANRLMMKCCLRN